MVDREELKRLAAEVSAVHGIRVDQDDPIMAVVTLNRMVLEQITSGLLKSLAESTQNLNEAAERVQIRAGVAIADQIRAQILIVRREIETESAPSRFSQCAKLGHNRGAAWLAAAGIAIFGAGVVLGSLLK